MKPRPPQPYKQRGYMLITLMLFVALLAIASLAWIQKIEFQIKRDREEELIHRGVQYSRAIQHFVKKFGRYPAKIEDLESTNNQRFLRRRYKDPITGKDFKLLHMNDVQISFSPGAASGLPPRSAGPSEDAGAPGSLNPNLAAAGAPGPTSIAGNAQPSGNLQPAQQTTAAGNDQAANNDDSGSDQNQQGPSNSNSRTGNNSPNPSGLGNGPTFGGMPIIGVASTSKDKSIREFNKKDHYNQWQFIYDPSTDRGGLLSTPNQPAIQGAVPLNQIQNGQPGSNGQNPSPTFGPGGMNNMGPQQPQMPQQQPNQQ
ncbi:MAG TPA: hypothetical protein VJ731_17315 [Terriglobales bacterium]|nr:hypothetical protein [Terriglobales bacterium]